MKSTRHPAGDPNFWQVTDCWFQRLHITKAVAKTKNCHKIRDKMEKLRKEKTRSALKENKYIGEEDKSHKGKMRIILGKDVRKESRE